MSKKFFILIIALMTVSLIGIIVVQIYWINSSIEIREKQFSNNVKFSLAKVSENIQHREFNDMYKKYAFVIDTVKKADKQVIRNFFYSQIDTVTNETFVFSQRVLEKNYKIPTNIFGNTNDTLVFKSIFRREQKKLFKNRIGSKDIKNISPERRLMRIGRLTKLEKSLYETEFLNISSRTPIYQRVSKNEIRSNLDNELKDHGIKTRFEFGIYSEGLATKVRSRNFKLHVGKSYVVPLFVQDDGSSKYQLFVSFPNKKEYIISTISKILILAVFFIFVIILAFASSLYQMIRQKQISEIKTEFINNMTHEFKTPIATINLALDAIKNPKIINENEKVLKYVNMIREENKRMHHQVENVLRISKLEKNQLEIIKETVDMQEVINDAISHVKLMINDKGGSIKTHFGAHQNLIKGNKFHLTNVTINILDNAIKYSSKEPDINIFTENKDSSLVVKIVDKGIGMSKNTKKQVFDKFYREQKGNIHNVKGHGLGLSYVKKIIENHQGKVSIESEKEKGSTFIVKLPLI